MIWVSFFLGAWLLASPSFVNPESLSLSASDILMGLIIMGFSGLLLRRSSLWLRWALAGCGVWLMSAPLLFWAPRMFTYINDSLVGIAVVALAVVFPHAKPTGGKATLDDWTYNPSAWGQRLPIVVVGFIAYIGATYLAFFQLGYIEDIWDPFFGEGTKRVLRSDVSRAFPVSDAGLGALAYMLECLSGLIGDTRRWRTMPWMALLFWVLVVPAGVVSIVLVMLQPIAVGAWCGLCLVTATLTLVTIPPALDEVILTGQYLLQKRREGKNVWRLFWKGEVLTGRAPEPTKTQATTVSLPWNLCATTLLGLGLMACPAWLGIEPPLSSSHYMTGALIITFSVIGMAEVGRAFRWVNLGFAAWTIIAPWILWGGSETIRFVDVVCGVAVFALARSPGRLRESHGVWDYWAEKLEKRLSLR